MKIKDLTTKKVLVKYGDTNDPYKYSMNLFDWYKEKVYQGDYPIEETEIEWYSALSKEGYLVTDRSTMPSSYSCMGSLPVTFKTPYGQVSPFGFVDFLHTQKHNHHNVWIYWRNFDGSTKGCASNNVEGHGAIPIGEDMVVSLWLDDKIFEDVIPGKKE